MFASPPHRSAARPITMPHKSIRTPANKTGGEYPSAIFIVANADPQNSTKSTNAKTAKRRSASTRKQPPRKDGDRDLVIQRYAIGVSTKLCLPVTTQIL